MDSGRGVGPAPGAPSRCSARRPSGCWRGVFAQTAVGTAWLCAPHGAQGVGSGRSGCGQRETPLSCAPPVCGSRVRREWGSARDAGRTWCGVVGGADTEGRRLRGQGAAPRAREREGSVLLGGGAASTGKINPLRGRDPYGQLRACLRVRAAEVAAAAGARSTRGRDGPFPPPQEPRPCAWRPKAVSEAEIRPVPTDAQTEAWFLSRSVSQGSVSEPEKRK